MLPVAGIQKFTTIDFPGALSCVLFTQGCPWKCRYCHNANLQTFAPAQSVGVPWPEVVKFLKSRRGCLDAVVVSGGEPTAHFDLAVALAEIRSLGFKIGLHTAGIYPERLRPALAYVDWVGFDLKAPLDERYDQITQVKNSSAAVSKSLEIILESKVPAEFRCTYHPLLLTEDAVDNLRKFLKDKEIKAPLVIQKFRSLGCSDLGL